MYEIFEKLLKERNISAYRVSKDTGISTATLTDWKKGRTSPKSDKLQKIAEYFNVSVDYLLGNEQKNSVSTLSADTDSQEVYRQIKKLPPEKQKQVFDYVRFLAEQKNEK